MIRGGRGKKLVAMVEDEESVSEDEETSKENRLIEREQNNIESASAMALNGDSLEVKETLISLSTTKNLVQDLIQAIDIGLIDQSSVALAAMVVDQEMIAEEEEETNKENRCLEREQINITNKNYIETATMMVLTGESLEVKEISLPKLTINNLAQDLILPEDNQLMNQSRAPLAEISPVEQTSEFFSQVTDLHYIQHEDVFCSNTQQDTMIDHNNLCNEDQESAVDGSSDENIELGNIIEVDISHISSIPDNLPPVTQNETANTLDATNSTTDQDPNNYNMNEGRQRKRKGDPSEWKRNVNKQLRMDGKPYLGFQSESNKIVQNKPRQGRRMKETCKSTTCEKAKNRHCGKFTEVQRGELFRRFWSMSWKERKAFVCTHVSEIETKRNTVSGRDSRRSFTMEYMLNNGSLNGNLQVCREMFLNTLGIGYRMMQLWVKDSKYNIPEKTNTRPRTSERTINCQQTTNLNMFLDSLPKMPSHYARQNSSKLYLEPVFSTKTDVYKLYKKYCEEKSSKPFTYKKFCEVFDEKNLSLFCVKKDKCNTCSSHETGNISDAEYNEHVVKKNRARQEKDQDKQEAERNKIIMLQVDFQAVKLAPFTYANAFYSKTKLACHNQTIMNVKTKHVKCYWFSEDQNNQLVASAFVSCLLDYLYQYCIVAEKTPIVIYSDGCTAQNRNNILANALLNFSMTTGIEVYQKFLEVGNTQMEVDSVHACIERKLKHREIKLPSDYVTIAKDARTSPSAYEAVELHYSFFKDYSKSEYLRYSSLRPGRTENDPCVTDIKVIFYNSEGVINVKIDFSDDEWMKLRQRPKNIQPINEYPQLFTERCKITKVKWQHLQELKSVIPRDCHSFYDDLPYKQ